MKWQDREVLIINVISLDSLNYVFELLYYKKKKKEGEREMCVPALSSLMDDMVIMQPLIYYIYVCMRVCCCFNHVQLFGPHGL